jgi:hypothetical protein
MRVTRFVLWTFAAVFTVIVGAQRLAAFHESADVSAASNELYLVISNSADSFSLTAYQTAPGCVYSIETNAQGLNSSGWGEWLRVSATGPVTPLSSLSASYAKMFFRAVVIGPAGTVGSNKMYLGEVRNGSNGNSNAAATEFKSWGRVVNPDGVANVAFGNETLTLTLPAGGHPHDLAAEIKLTNAPRILKSVQGDFTIQVRTEGEFGPGEISTQPYRRAYNGAALIVMDGPSNVVTLARAGLQYQGQKATYYGNFEMRTDGKLDRIGLNGDRRLPASGTVYLKLDKRAGQITASTSLDGVAWRTIGTKRIPSSWPQTLSAGVAVISTSEAEFSPRFSELGIK